MSGKTQRKIKQLKREKKAEGLKMQSAMEAKNWKEARSHYFWFHYLGDQINKLESEDAK